VRDANKLRRLEAPGVLVLWRKKGNRAMKKFLLFTELVAMIATVPSVNAQVTRNSHDWKFWKYEYLKALAPRGDSGGDARDVVAIYVKEDAKDFRKQDQWRF
jgi:hypothetical protein